MNKKQKFCPFVKQACIANQCELYNELLNRCEIPVLAYNTYRLSEAIKNTAQGGSKEKSGAELPNLPETPFGRS